jgi:hypothetical protein
MCCIGVERLSADKHSGNIALRSGQPEREEPGRILYRRGAQGESGMVKY